MKLKPCQLARDFDFTDGPSLGIFDEESREVVGTACDTSTRDLFVAAPDLLDALKGLLFCHVHGNGLDAHYKARDRAQAAIEKAEGL